MNLTPRQARFVEEYLVDLNAKDAAIRAGYSNKATKQQGHKTLQAPAVQEAVTAAVEARSKRTGITADRVLDELAAIGFGDMGDYANIDPGTGRLVLDMSALPEGGTALIQEVTQEEWVEGRGEDAERVRKTKIKLYSKLEALEKLARHLKLYDGVMKHEHEHDHKHEHTSHTVTMTAAEVDAEIEELFGDGAPALPAPLVPTKH